MKTRHIGIYIIRFFKKYRLLAAIIVLSALLTMISPAFFSITNIINILWNVAVVGIMAVGMTFVILTGGIDLSVGSVVCATGVATALFFDPLRLPLVVTLLLVAVIGTLLGLGNGLLVSRARIAPFIVTLATMVFYRGMTLFATNGVTLGVLKPASFLEIGLGKILGIPVPIIIFAVIAVIGWFLSQKTTFGRSIYILGGNRTAALMSGIPVKRVEMIAYIISGFCAGISGIVLTSLVQQAGSYQGVGFELDVIAAVVVGGTSMFGGAGRVFDSVLGAIFIGIIANGLSLLNVPSPYHPIVKGLVVLVAVGFEINLREYTKE
ncbi:ribose ABC transporter [Candidatus Vecturithrix granuli]|uniref:Ribose ABC transporter n=1 Tax=Vecturithrix granuli TaxID=1499967 RepID=A0A081C5S2_VECG1|nr:ribose ABC transporter [Candidatus Vecturithrix granuli]